ncbi:MAG: hypothetical protein M3396_10995, partial [Actinomycetota bacterium]|nr:hypothetical protein [Actinomycetota bacterium]
MTRTRLPDRRPLTSPITSPTTLDPLAVASVVERALAEDLGVGDGGATDLTTNALFGPEVRCRARLLVKEPGVVCGLPAADAVFRTLDAGVRFQQLVSEGDRLDEPGEVAFVEGAARAVLTGE